MNSIELLKSTAREIEKDIEKIYTDYKKRFPQPYVLKDFFDNTFATTFAGGKRVRGTFLYYSYLLNNGRNINNVLRISSALELIQSYLLIHDDIQDNSNTRHGIETIHAKYKKIIISGNHRRIKDHKHFGESIGINAGDIMNHIAHHSILNSNISDEHKVMVLSILSEHIIEVGYGQTLDIFGEILEDVDEDYVLLVHELKTGRYTYELPILLGATLAGANNEEKEVLSKFAVPGGIAYQIIDDIIGVYGSEEVTGKPVSSDIKEGKTTLLTIKAYQGANLEEKKVLDGAIGNEDADEETMDRVRKIIADTGSLEYSHKLAEKLLNKSTKALQNYENGFNKEAKDFFIGINDFMHQRNK